MSLMATENEPPEDDGAPGDDDAAKGKFKEWLDEWAGEYVEKNKPAPKRTDKPKGLLEGLMGFGSS